jgi:threonine dehydratase
LREEARLVKFRVAVADVPGTLGQAASLIGSHGGQIIQTYHDRLDSPSPTTVGITFVVEVRDKKHSTRILKALQQHLGWAELL